MLEHSLSKVLFPQSYTCIFLPTCNLTSVLDALFEIRRVYALFEIRRVYALVEIRRVYALLEIRRVYAQFEIRRV